MESTDQRAYDRGVTVFSPDGRLYQVEYAREAVKHGSPTVGVRAADSVVLATRARPRSPLVDPDSIEKLHDVDGRLAVASAGHVADGRRLVDYAREFAQRDRLRYGEPPGVEGVAKAVADYIQESTQTGGTRPFGVALLIAGVTDDGPGLYRVDPSGRPDAWHATAAGSGSAAIREFLEAEYEPGLDADAGLSLALRALAKEAEDGEDLSADEVDVAALDADGIQLFDRDRRATALADAGLSSAS